MKKKKRYSTQEHVKIVFEIFKLVPYSHKTTAQAIQQQLIEQEIYRDIRTVQRNLHLLVSMGFVDQDTRSKPYGYQNISNKLTPLGRKEALIFQLALNHIHGLLPNNAIKALNGRFEDAKLILHPNTENTKERQWLRKVMSKANHHGLSISQSLIEKITTALYHNHWINLYVDTTGSNPLYHMPLGLIQKDTGIELVTGVYREQALITHRFNLNDIQDVKLSTFTFEYPEHFNLKSHLETKRKTQ
ncbi:WYL domain-containing protein [Vibrio ziniensis]|uniref:WYL domain-containing protein n=1 Tax=Vibrio ziniensis TaxID=2711221 RepID=A0A6G7CGD4_9VIBR|nr:WYL domain-containing protein [Vibrio ziniensis]QIH41098.1 WYL domain-containing protein [Vibrio ziniensis]